MFFIDIAVPRDVDPRMNEVEGCFVYDIDDLQQVAAANLADRSREAQAAETIVTREVDKYQQRLQSLDATPAIRNLQEHAESLRQAELRRSAARLAGLTAEQQAAVEALTRSLTNKFLHAPMTALRDAAREGDAQALAELESLYTNHSRNKPDSSNSK
jgi:glutamyl-tRNA reductase